MSHDPVFILGIQRGGTNQFLNILRSHPEIYWPQGEFHEVFRSKGLRKDGVIGYLTRQMRYAPVRKGVGDILDPDVKPQGAGLLRGARGEAVRAGLAASAEKNMANVTNYKAALAATGLIDLAAQPARMLNKVMNYNLAFAEDLQALYPQARFVGVIRDGRGVCEGHISRGASVETATDVYNFVAQRLIDLENSGFPVKTWRFEDLLADAEAVAREVFDFCKLDLTAMRGVCLQDKERRVDASGQIIGMDKVAKYYTFADMGAHMRQDANTGSLSRLPEAQQAQIAERCETALAHFGYLPETS